MAVDDRSLWAERGFIAGGRLSPNPQRPSAWHPILWHVPSQRFMWFPRAAFASYAAAKRSAEQVLTRNSIAGRLDVMLNDMTELTGDRVG